MHALVSFVIDGRERIEQMGLDDACSPTPFVDLTFRDLLVCFALLQQVNLDRGVTRIELCFQNQADSQHAVKNVGLEHNALKGALLLNGTVKQVSRSSHSLKKPFELVGHWLGS